MTVFVCGGCGQELQEEKPDFYRCSKCDVEIDDREKQIVKGVSK